MNAHIDTRNLISPLTAYQIDRLGVVHHFLLTVSDPRLLSKAIIVGYNQREHEQGLTLHQIASGQDRPLSHALANARYLHQINQMSFQQSAFEQLDVAENLWFPRTRNAIRRFVDPSERDTFEKTFFHDLNQQPLGPGVVASLSTLLDRIQALKTSDVPGALAAFASLQQKGLTDDVVAALRAEIDRLSVTLPELPEREIPMAVLEAAAERQLSAYQDLNLWYIDWADALRPVMTHKERVRLRLSIPRHSLNADADLLDNGPQDT